MARAARVQGPPPEVAAYYARAPPAHRAALLSLRKQILAAAPGATERISYQMPAFARGGVLVWIAAFKEHCSLFATLSGAALARESGLKGFEVSKGTIRFAPEKPLPAVLVRRIVKARIVEVDARAAKRGAAKVGSPAAKKSRKRAGAKAAKRSPKRAKRG